MLTIYFMRHAESEANRQNLLASRRDFALTTKGETAAATIAREFSDLTRVDRVVASPLRRAQQTAVPFAAAFDVAVETDERLTEQELGVFSGMTYEELERAPGYQHDRAGRWEWVPPGGGESYEMIAKRLSPFFVDLDAMSTGSILFVTHAVTMRLIRACLERTLPEYPLEIAKNGEIWKVAYRGSGTAHVVESLFLGDSAKESARA